MEIFSDCRLCPRSCHADRENGEKGYCGVPAAFMVARAALHMWEEPCISGTCGSGAVFFSGCSLGCVFCQNHEISRGQAGRVITPKRLEEICWELKEQGAANINLVTPDHYIPALVPVLQSLKAQGFDLPFVYNGSGYVRADVLRELEGLIDIYLPDYKYHDGEVAAAYSRAADYPQVVRAAVREMTRQVPEAELDAHGMMKRGVIVRHLLLPGQLLAAKQIVKYLYETYGDTIYISLMNQYTPTKKYKAFFDAYIARASEDINVKQEQLYRRLLEPVSKKNYKKLVDYAVDLGVTRGFMQEGGTAKESFIPAFDLQGV